MMKALKWSKEKRNVELTDAALPDTLGKNDVRVKVKFAGVCGSDFHMMKGGHLKDKLTLGHEISGVIDQMGEYVNNLKQGDHVAVFPMQHCGSCK